MANRCDTCYKMCGSNECTKKFWDALNELGVNSKRLWLHELASHFGIDCEKKGLRGRGEVYYAELDEGQEDHILTICTDTAWTGFHELFHFINREVYGGNLLIDYMEVEPGCGIYCIHNENGFFEKECYVDASFEFFGEEAEGAYDTIDEAIEFWCDKMNESRGTCSQQDMVSYINKYEYEDSDVYFYINEFERE